MALPWFQIIDAAVGLFQFTRSRRPAGELMVGEQRIEPRLGILGALESRLTGVMVAALKEAFDRDARRLELEREHIEAERRRAERVLKLELLRQAADREIARLRLVSGVAVVSFIGTLLLASRVVAGPTSARALLGLGWALLLAALGAAFSAQSQIEDALLRETVPSAPGGRLAPWLVVSGFVFIGLAVLSA